MGRFGTYVRELREMLYGDPPVCLKMGLFDWGCVCRGIIKKQARSGAPSGYPTEDFTNDKTRTEKTNSRIYMMVTAQSRSVPLPDEGWTERDARCPSLIYLDMVTKHSLCLYICKTHTRCQPMGTRDVQYFWSMSTTSPVTWFNDTTFWTTFDNRQICSDPPPPFVWNKKMEKKIICLCIHFICISFILVSIPIMFYFKKEHRSVSERLLVQRLNFNSRWDRAVTLKGTNTLFPIISPSRGKWSYFSYTRWRFGWNG